MEEIGERIQGDREIAVPTPRAKFSALLRMTAAVYGTSEKELSQTGRQRKWVKARSMLVYLRREWGRVSVKELGRRLHRDPSIYQPAVLGVCRRSRPDKGETVSSKTSALMQYERHLPPCC